MAKSSFHISIQDNTGTALDAMHDANLLALSIIGGKAEKFAKALTPVGTPESTGIKGYMGGTLRNSITFVTSKQEGKTITVDPQDANPLAENHGGNEEEVPPCPEEYTLYIGTNVYYAQYVENGHGSYKPRHFLKNAIGGHTGLWKKIWHACLSGKKT